MGFNTKSLIAVFILLNIHYINCQIQYCSFYHSESKTIIDLSQYKGQRFEDQSAFFNPCGLMKYQTYGLDVYIRSNNKNQNAGLYSKHTWLDSKKLLVYMENIQNQTASTSKITIQCGINATFRFLGAEDPIAGKFLFEFTTPCTTSRITENCDFTPTTIENFENQLLGSVSSTYKVLNKDGYFLTKDGSNPVIAYTGAYALSPAYDVFAKSSDGNQLIAGKIYSIQFSGSYPGFSGYFGFRSNKTSILSLRFYNINESLIGMSEFSYTNTDGSLMKLSFCFPDNSEKIRRIVFDGVNDGLVIDQLGVTYLYDNNTSIISTPVSGKQSTNDSSRKKKVVAIAVVVPLCALIIGGVLIYLRKRNMSASKYNFEKNENSIKMSSQKSSSDFPKNITAS